ncbi:MAG: hypothetical protein ABIP94_21305 [Planctomycetota bacterium]
MLAVFVFGDSWTTWNGAPLPFNLSLIGSHPDCWLSSSASITLALVTGFTGGASQVVSVPS